MTTTSSQGGATAAPPNLRFGDLRSVGGYQLDEVVSALQKSIRRGFEDDAVFWATELDLSGYGQHCWRRLLIICSEDVGLAQPGIAAEVRSLYENWTEFRKRKEDRTGAERLFLCHAVLLLAGAAKSRLVDHALITMYLGDRPHREVPDYALDHHTRRGRQKGRRIRFFFEEGARLENAAPIEDPYLPAARHWLAHPVRRQPEEEVKP